MTNLKLVFPNDETILGYDMESLEKTIVQHRENINIFQQHVADEQARIALYESIIKRKRELESADS